MLVALWSFVGLCASIVGLTFAIALIRGGKGPREHRDAIVPPAPDCPASYGYCEACQARMRKC